MGRYYYGDIEGKFMFAVQSSQAGCRFGAEEMEQSTIDYFVERDQYKNLSKELKLIEDSGAVERVKNMWKGLEEEGELGYNDDTCKKYGVSKLDVSEYADWKLGTKMKDFFDDNPEEDSLTFNAEL
jgi:hypothetical protein